jgi:hypothetical protein
MTPDRVFYRLVLAEAIARPIIGAALLHLLGAPWWAAAWFILAGFRLRIFYRRPPKTPTPSHTSAQPK